MREKICTMTSTTLVTHLTERGGGMREVEERGLQGACMEACGGASGAACRGLDLGCGGATSCTDVEAEVGGPHAARAHRGGRGQRRAVTLIPSRPKQDRSAQQLLFLLRPFLRQILAGINTNGLRPSHLRQLWRTFITPLHLKLFHVVQTLVMSSSSL
jgi:hypothetical protein